MINDLNGRLNLLFDDSTFYRNLFKVALPIIIQNLIASLLNMVDTVMIGRVGETEIAAVGIANQYFFLFSIIIMGIFSGCGVFISQFWGKRDMKNIKRVVGLGLIIGIIISFIFTLIALICPYKIISIFNSDPRVIEFGGKYLKIVSLSYITTAITLNFGFALRCIERAALPMVVSAIALTCNTFFNYVLIFGHFKAPALGVEGAAIATVIARVVETILIISYIYIKKLPLSSGIKELFDFNGVFVSKVFKTVIPVVLNELCWGLGAVMYSVVYGRIGKEAVASTQICTTIQNIFMVLTFGMANASAVMIGNRIGAGDDIEAVKYAERFSILGCIVGIVIGVMIASSANFVLSFFNVSNKVIHDSILILYIVAVIMFVRVFNIILIVGILRGGGDSKYAMKIEAFTMWCIGVPIAFIGAFYFKLPVYLVSGLVTVEEIAKFILGFKRLKSNKWMKNVIHNI